MDKKCFRCSLVKSLEEFDIRNLRKDGRESFCKQCRRDRQNYYRKLYPRSNNYKHINRPPGYWFKYQKARRERVKAEYNIGSGMLTRYGLKVCLAVFALRGRICRDCGSSEDLTFHHLDGHGRNHEKRRTRHLINNSPDNLVVLCRRCHGRIDGKKNKGIKRCKK